MAKFDNTNRGSIWKNKRKEMDTHPDFTGSINVDGTEYWLNGWLRKAGASPESPSMTFSVRSKEARTEVTDKEVRQTRREDMNDEIPF